MTPDCEGLLRELLHRTDQFLASESGSRLASVAANNYAKDVKADIEYALSVLAKPCCSTPELGGRNHAATFHGR